MTVTELRDALNALIEQGHGELPVCSGILTKMNDYYYDEVERVEHVADGSDFDFPGPLIKIQ